MLDFPFWIASFDVYWIELRTTSNPSSVLVATEKKYKWGHEISPRIFCQDDGSATAGRSRRASPVNMLLLTTHLASLSYCRKMTVGIARDDWNVSRVVNGCKYTP